MLCSRRTFIAQCTRSLPLPTSANDELHDAFKPIKLRAFVRSTDSFIDNPCLMVHSFSSPQQLANAFRMRSHTVMLVLSTIGAQIITQISSFIWRHVA
ncbi:hypothetical protein BV22DRAFT_97149 [Leucogyrophana mollusca]|uniref:Uncharacterized protein n=1 Tax=Leucogyrophana mollusca TaxID=85980 RepID=A0ACB8BXX1_9AGAM|nr:hypothetical protein BV22DRAFT_97149 [Leucogyrophana mollusca]